MNTRLLKVSNMNKKTGKWCTEKFDILGEMWVEIVD
jgi:hypothetical protein